MTDRYEVRSTSGKPIGTIEKVEGSSYGGFSDPDVGFSALLLGNPFIAAVAGVVGWLLGTLITHLGKTVVAAGAKALGASPSSVGGILTADSWAIGGWIGWLIFFGLLLYLTAKWFTRPDNRETFTFTVIAIVVIVVLVGGWQFLNSYVSK